LTPGGSPRHPNPWLLWTLIGLMQSFWTANFLISKVALREFPAPLVAGLRILVAFGCVLPVYCWKVHGRDQWTRRDLPMLLLLGVVGVGINQCLFILGLSRTSVAHSAIMISMSPVWVLLFSALRGLERITVRKVAGLSAAFAGAVLLALERSPGGGAGPALLGDVLTLLASMAFAAYTVMSKEVNHRFGVFTVNTFLFGAGSAVLFPLVVWEGWSFEFSKVSTVGWLALAYMGVFPSFVCYLIFYHALGYVTASRLTMLAYVQPVAATLFGVVLLGEGVTAALVAGGAAILSGVYLAERA
jgi:drug/metabolite transporter (DMT)-like permease